MARLSKIRVEWLKETDYFRITIGDKTFVVKNYEIYELMEELEWQQKDYYLWRGSKK